MSSIRSRQSHVEHAPGVSPSQRGVTGSLGQETLEQSVLRSLDRYFSDLNGARPHALHELVMQAVERPLLKFAVDRCAGNQSAAADLLGISFRQLRYRMQRLGIHEPD